MCNRLVWIRSNGTARQKFHLDIMQVEGFEGLDSIDNGARLLLGVSQTEYKQWFRDSRILGSRLECSGTERRANEEKKEPRQNN